MKITIEEDGYIKSINDYDCRKDSIKIFEDIIGEYSQFRYLVCKDYCSKETIIGAFNDKLAAESFCSLQNMIHEIYPQL